MIVICQHEKTLHRCRQAAAAMGSSVEADVLLLEQVQKVNDIPIGLEVAVGVCCCISPIMLVIAYFIEKKKLH